MVRNAIRVSAAVRSPSFGRRAGVGADAHMGEGDPAREHFDVAPVVGAPAAGRPAAPCYVRRYGPIQPTSTAHSSLESLASSVFRRGMQSERLIGRSGSALVLHWFALLRAERAPCSRACPVTISIRRSSST